MTVYQKTTTCVHGIKNVSERSLPVTDDDGRQELELINLYPEVGYQTVEFFGGAFTDSVGAILSSLPPETADAVIRSCFGADGLRYRAIRTHMDSCDFSTGAYCAMSDPTDSALSSFSIARDEKRIIPWIKAACRAAGCDLPVMLTPWSPPSFMKTNASRIGGGRLRPEYRRLWAEYICRYVSEYRQRGINVRAISIQNEPNAVQTWESCIYSAEEERDFLTDVLYPALIRHGLNDVEVYVWDHNKERAFDRACAEITEKSSPMIAGLAFHWYSGDHFDALRLIRERFPEKKLVFTEGCIEYSRYSRDALANAQKYAHDMLGNFNAGMNAFYDWNICLDADGGPNQVSNFCEAPIMCDLRTGETEYRLSYDYIGHISHFVLPGAVRIALTKFTDRLDAAAFRNPDGAIVSVLLNREETEQTVFLRLCGKLVQTVLPAGSITTVVIK